MKRLPPINELKKKYKLTNNELMKSMHKCLKYYLSEDELENFLIKKKSKK